MINVLELPANCDNETRRICSTTEEAGDNDDFTHTSSTEEVGEYTELENVQNVPIDEELVKEDEESANVLNHDEEPKNV